MHFVLKQNMSCQGLDSKCKEIWASAAKSDTATSTKNKAPTKVATLHAERQPCLGREPVRNVRNFEQRVEQTRLLCKEFHKFIHLHHPLVSIRRHIPITFDLRSLCFASQSWQLLRALAYTFQVSLLLRSTWLCMEKHSISWNAAFQSSVTKYCPSK